jgi:hypothetical protein
MELLRTALERETHGGAGRDAVVRRIVRRHHVELGDGILCRHDVHAAGAAAVVCFAAVDEPDVMALAESVHADGEVGCNRGWCVAVRQCRADAEAEGRKGCKVAVFGGDFADLLRADEGADDVGVRLDLERVGFNCDGLVFCADRQLGVYTESG